MVLRCRHRGVEAALAKLASTTLLGSASLTQLDGPPDKLSKVNSFSQNWQTCSCLVSSQGQGSG